MHGSERLKGHFRCKAKKFEFNIKDAISLSLSWAPGFGSCRQ